MPRKGTIRSDVASSELAANRKSKSKARKTKVDGTQTKGENTMNQVEGQEVNTAVEVPEIPATIVESGEAEVFAEQAEGQEVVNVDTTAEETVVAAGADTATEPVEQPAPKPPKVSKRPFIALVEQHLELGNLDKKELLALIMEKYPEVNKNGVSTFLTDALNPKYSHWKDRVVSKTVDGKMIFADKIEEPAPDVQTAEVQPEQPAE